MKILTWNVNGIRAREKNGLIEALKEINPDIICLQEVRAREEQLSIATRKYFSDNFAQFCLSEHERKGYAGVLTLSKEIGNGLRAFDDNAETGREYISFFENFVLYNLYSPNSGRNLEKLDHRMNWEDQLRDSLSKCNKPVIICGDMNVAPEKQDCNVFSKAGTSEQERLSFSLLKKVGFNDVYRHFHPFTQDFTWFSNQYDSRSVNKGMRIDHFLVSPTLLPKVHNIEIIKDPKLCCGSDHCPVILDIDL